MMTQTSRSLIGWIAGLFRRPDPKPRPLDARFREYELHVDNTTRPPPATKLGPERPPMALPADDE